MRSCISLFWWDTDSDRLPSHVNMLLWSILLCFIAVFIGLDSQVDKMESYVIVLNITKILSFFLAFHYANGYLIICPTNIYSLQMSNLLFNCL